MSNVPDAQEIIPEKDCVVEEEVYQELEKPDWAPDYDPSWDEDLLLDILHDPTVDSTIAQELLGADDPSDNTPFDLLFKKMSTEKLYTGSNYTSLEAFLLIQQFMCTANVNKTNSVLLLKLLKALLPTSCDIPTNLRKFLKVVLLLR